MHIAFMMTRNSSWRKWKIHFGQKMLTLKEKKWLSHRQQSCWIPCSITQLNLNHLCFLFPGKFGANTANSAKNGWLLNEWTREHLLVYDLMFIKSICFLTYDISFCYKESKSFQYLQFIFIDSWWRYPGVWTLQMWPSLGLEMQIFCPNQVDVKCN